MSESREVGLYILMTRKKKEVKKYLTRLEMRSIQCALSLQSTVTSQLIPSSLQVSEKTYHKFKRLCLKFPNRDVLKFYPYMSVCMFVLKNCLSSLFKYYFNNTYILYGIVEEMLHCLLNTIPGPNTVFKYYLQML